MAKNVLTRKIIPFILAFAMLVVYMPTMAFAGVEAGGDDVAQIGATKYSDLRQALLACQTGETVELLQNVDLSETTWTPVSSFGGTFDGKNHTITGLTVSGENNVGMFDVLNGVIVKDLTIKGASVTATGDKVGAVAGASGPLGSEITNVKVIDSSITTNGEYVGTLIGHADADIKSCEATNNVISGAEQVGGLIGYMWCGFIEDCTVNNSVTADSRAGGLIGKLQIAGDNIGVYPTDKMWITGCEIAGTIDGGDTAGGIAGQIMGDDARYEISNNSITAEIVGTKSNSFFVLRADQSETFTNAFITNILNNTVNEVEKIFTKDGEVKDVIATIGTAKYSDLRQALLACKSGQTVELIKDVDLSETTWTPVSSFSGTFDGNNHTITGLKVSGTEKVGMFAALQGTVKDLTITGAKITSTSGNYQGVLAGTAGPATITNVKILNSEVTSAGEYVGGLFGQGYANVSGCTLTGNVITGDEQVGGVVGYMVCGGIKDTVVNNTVTANSRAGGLVGKLQIAADNNGRSGGTSPAAELMYINNNTISGTINGGSATGGIIGQLMGDYNPAYGDVFEIKYNDVSAVLQGTSTNPITILRASQPEAFTNSFEDNIVGNTVNGIEKKYSNAGECKDFTVEINDDQSVSFEKQTLEVKTSGIEVEEEIINAIQQSTKVLGLTLKTTAEEGEKSGVQALIDAAKEQAEKNENQEFSNALNDASDIYIKVNVQVTPEKFAVDQEEQTKTVKFDLKPIATVKVGQETQEVPVTNDMIDTSQEIKVALYIGFKPEMLIHRDDNGKVIETFGQSDFQYDEATGICTLTINHFSTVEATSELAVAKIGNVGYTTLAEAVKNVKDGETIILLKNNTETITIEKAADVNNAKQFIIDTNGFTWTTPTVKKCYEMSSNNNLYTIGAVVATKEDIEAAIAAEKKAREAADKAEITLRTSGDDAVKALVEAEEAARAAADAEEKAERETLAAQYTALANQIAQIKADLEAADLTEKTAREAADTLEKAEREAADAALQAQIDAEKQAREAAETILEQLQDAVDALETKLDAQGQGEETSQSTIKNLQKQITELKTKIETLETKLTEEKAARIDADDKEERAREAADYYEKLARDAADALEKAARDAADTLEKQAREAADAALQAQIDAEKQAREAAEKAAKEEAAKAAAAIEELQQKLAQEELKNRELEQITSQLQAELENVKAPAKVKILSAKKGTKKGTLVVKIKKASRAVKYIVTYKVGLKKYSKVFTGTKVTLKNIASKAKVKIYVKAINKYGIRSLASKTVTAYAK